MTVRLNEKLQRFVDEQVKAGRFRSTDDVLEEALLRMMEEDSTSLDDATLDAIDRSEQQIERGEYRDWKDVAAELRARYIRG